MDAVLSVASKETTMVLAFENLLANLFHLAGRYELFIELPKAVQVALFKKVQMRFLLYKGVCFGVSLS